MAPVPAVPRPTAVEHRCSPDLRGSEAVPRAAASGGSPRVHRCQGRRGSTVACDGPVRGPGGCRPGDTSFGQLSCSSSAWRSPGYAGGVAARRGVLQCWASPHALPGVSLPTPGKLLLTAPGRQALSPSPQRGPAGRLGRAFWRRASPRVDGRLGICGLGAVLAFGPSDRGRWAACPWSCFLLLC